MKTFSMVIIDFILPIIILIITCYIAFFKKYANSYFAEKGKNLATKKDIAEITEKIESVKSQFDISKISYQIRFNKLHERRAVIIEEFYEKLVRLKIAIEEETANSKVYFGTTECFETMEIERNKETIESYTDFSNFYNRKKLFFTEEERNIIDRIIKEYNSRYIDYMKREKMYSQKPLPTNWQEIASKATEASTYIENEIPKILVILEAEFQRFYGMNN